MGPVHGGGVYGGPLGIRVNAVAPGIVPTELFAAAATTTGGKNDMEQRASTTPLRRAGTAEEIAGVVAFLLSDDSVLHDRPGDLGRRRRHHREHRPALRRRRGLGHHEPWTRPSTATTDRKEPDQ